MSDMESGPGAETDAAHGTETRRPAAALWAAAIAVLVVHNVEEAALGLNRWAAAPPWFPAHALQLSDG